MDRVSFLLPKVLQKRGLKDEVDASHLVHFANAWLREQKAPEDALVAKYRNGVVVITVENSTSAQECYELSEDLLQALHKKFVLLPLEKIHILRNLNPVVG